MIISSIKCQIYWTPEQFYLWFFFFFVIFESSPKTVDDLFPLSVVLFSDLSLFHLSRFFWAVQMIHFIIKWKISISDIYVVYKICATKQCVYLVKYFINNLHLSNASVSARFCINILSLSVGALKDSLGLQLVGPFDILAGAHKNSKNSQPNFHLHWRYFYDPPEFQTILAGCENSQHHIGYYRYRT